MMKIIEIFFIVFGIACIVFRKWNANIIVEWQKSFDPWPEKPKDMKKFNERLCIVSGIIFLAIGILGLIDVIKFKD